MSTACFRGLFRTKHAQIIPEQYPIFLPFHRKQLLQVGVHLFSSLAAEAKGCKHPGLTLSFKQPRETNRNLDPRDKHGRNQGAEPRAEASATPPLAARTGRQRCLTEGAAYQRNPPAAAQPRQENTLGVRRGTGSRGWQGCGEKQGKEGSWLALLGKLNRCTGSTRAGSADREPPREPQRGPGHASFSGVCGQTDPAPGLWGHAEPRLSGRKGRQNPGSRGVRTDRTPAPGVCGQTAPRLPGCADRQNPGSRGARPPAAAPPSARPLPSRRPPCSRRRGRLPLRSLRAVRAARRGKEGGGPAALCSLRSRSRGCPGLFRVPPHTPVRARAPRARLAPSKWRRSAPQCSPRARASSARTPARGPGEERAGLPRTAPAVTSREPSRTFGAGRGIPRARPALAAGVPGAAVTDRAAARGRARGAGPGGSAARLRERPPSAAAGQPAGAGAIPA
ncbi:translation initiation factor IF-2-like [Passer montanus]|uniref:translation initiation factor IF-2-like n=1 Tax=Passer montanus TaxID=9160 RepID=UPI001961A161|nr:translation initiation factor IF-2-like [Passer montanus]